MEPTRHQPAEAFQELMDGFRQAAPVPTPAPAPAAVAAPAPNPAHPLPPSLHSGPVVNPATYSGSPDSCKGFLLQCSLMFEMQPTRFPSERAKIAYIISLLSGKALQWAETIWDTTGPVMQTTQRFMEHFKEVFSLPDGDSSIQARLYALRQGRLPINEYALQFRTLAAASGWNEPALITVFRQGLKPSLRLHLSAYDDTIGLERFIQLAIRVSHRREGCFQVGRITPSTSSQSSNNTTPADEAMEVDTIRLTPAERRRRLENRLCLYCGELGHTIAHCPIRPPRPMVSTVLPPAIDLKPLMTAAQLYVTESPNTVYALLDSGSAGNFISGALCDKLQIPRVRCSSVFTVQSVMGKPLSPRQVNSQTPSLQLRIGCLHVEAISLHILEESVVDLVLGRPWLMRHSPVISWSTGEITRWGETCRNQCFPQLPLTRVATLAATSVESPSSQQQVYIPSQYASFQDVFSPQRATELPPHRPWDCAIDLIPGQPLPRGKIYSLSLPEQAAMETYIEEALRNGYIQPSKSPAASSFFFIAKKDGGLRPCVDYRILNKATVKFRYPLPLVPAALESLRGSSVFSKLDLRSAYNLVRIRKGDEWKTAFITPTGHWEYKVMPYGLANAPSVFQGFMNEILRDFLHKFVIVYIDDILIHSPDLPSHVDHVTQVLTRLRDHNLFLKAEKCEFHQPTVQFLGYQIHSQGVSMDIDKVDAVKSWPQPQTIKELQRFLGFANFYRRFINNFSQLSAPLTSMLRNKPRRLQWSPESIHAFQQLRVAFTTAPLLQHPDPNLPFIVEVDASTTGVGAVLSQPHGESSRLHPCAYFSKKMSTAECNYDIGNRELLAIKLALEHWRHWLEGAKVPFTVLTDHKNLQYLREARRLNTRQARWALFFTRFQFSIKYRPGTQNGRADALSRLYAPEESSETRETILPPSVLVCPIQWALDEEIRKALESEPAPSSTPANHMYVPQAIREKLLSAAHSVPGTGHPGTGATLTLLSEKYWWPGMTRDVRQFTRKCIDCAMTKSPRHLPAGKLLPLPIPRRPWSHLGIDYATDLPPSNGNTSILVVVDRFSKACKLIPMRGVPTAPETAEALFHHVFRNFGLPEDIVSDRGPQFISRFWRAFLRLLGVTVSLSSGYHPQTNGQTERKIQEINRFLRTYCHRHPESWSQFLPWAEYAQNSLHQPTTGLTPFQCVLGHQPPMFPWTGEPSEVPAVNKWFQESERVWARAHRHLRQALQRRRRCADARRSQAPAYAVGQKVWLSTRDLRMKHPCKKLRPRYIGPFLITHQINSVTYRLQLPPQYRIHPVFHVSLLKPFYSPDSPSPTDAGTAALPPPPLLLDEGPAYAVHQVLNSRRAGVTSSTWLIGKGTAQKSALGFAGTTSSTPPCLKTFTALIPIDRHLVLVVDPVAGCPRPGRWCLEGGVLSRLQRLHFHSQTPIPLNEHQSGPLHQSINDLSATNHLITILS